jgi:hypothetical protein
MNCFDTTFLLVDGLVNFRCGPDDPVGPFIVPFTRANGDAVTASAASPRDAFNLVYPSWWVAGSRNLFPESSQPGRMAFTATFDSFIPFPKSTRRENLSKVLFKTFQSNWKRCGVEFSKKIKTVIFYSVSTSDHNSLGAHSGVLLENKKHYVYIEKVSPSGPYVRLDFEKLDDLFAWYKSVVRPVSDNGNTAFATINNDAIYDLGN